MVSCGIKRCSPTPFDINRLHHNAILSRQRSRVRVSSSPPSFPGPARRHGLERVNELHRGSQSIDCKLNDRSTALRTTVLNDLHPVLHLSTLKGLGPYTVPDTDSARQRRRIHCWML